MRCFELVPLDSKLTLAMYVAVVSKDKSIRLAYNIVQIDIDSCGFVGKFSYISTSATYKLY